MKAWRALWLAAGVAACGPGTTPATASHPAPDPAPAPADRGLRAALAEAALGVDDPALAALLREHWAWVLERDPLRATELGVRDFDDRLESESLEAIAAARTTRDQLLARARALAPSSDRDRVTLALFVAELEASQAADVCAFELWSLSPRYNALTRYNHLPELHAVDSLADGRNLVARYRAIAARIDEETARLRLGLARGYVATRETIRRIVEQVDKQLAAPVAEWPMLAPAARAHDDWPAEDLAAFRHDLRAAVAQGVKPALERWAAVLRDELMPRGRSDAQSGIVALPDGRACYDALILGHTTLALSAQQIHDIGLEEIAALDGAIAALGRASLGTATLADTLDKLRSDRSLYFDSAEQIEQAAQRALDDAKAAIADHFGVLPKADCVIRRVPDYEAPYTTIAYYRPPHPDGQKPGEYFVNVLDPQTRPRFEARVLAIHESIPGHHLQIAIAQELGQSEATAVPAFRKHGGVTAFVEGWALYTERLGEEMGLYRDDLDRMGMLSFDAWRAGRLVVDTGIHAFGWSRSRAKAFLLAHTALTPENIDNEVDRYISWPGQALAYKLGQREIWALRKEAEQKLGARFSPAAFHDAVLTGGAVTLPVLRQQVAKFVQASAAD